MDKIAILDNFASGIKSSMVNPGGKLDFVIRHHRPILGTLAGAYLLSKIIPAIYNVSHTEKDEELQAAQAYFLQNIAENQARQAGPITPARDSYNYVF
jgi:hypothetical protein